MITEAIVRIFASIFLAFASILPTSQGIPEVAQNAFVGLSGFLGKANYLFPIDTLLEAITWYVGFLLAVFIALMTFKILKWFRVLG